MKSRHQIPGTREGPLLDPLGSNSEPAWRWSSWLILLLIVLLTVAPFLPTLWNEFVGWDDDKNLLDNPHYRGLGWTQLTWMFTTFHMGHYQPLSWMTFGLDYLLWGLDPVGYHLTNLLLHAGNALLVYCLTLRLLPLALPSPPGPGKLPLRAAAGFAALVFAIHPLRVESVAWATERRDVLSGLFLLSTIICYLRASTIAHTDRTRQRRLTVSVLLYVLSLLSKAGGITLPIILLMLDVYPLRRLGGSPGKWFNPAARRVWGEKLPFLLLALPAGVLAAIAQAHFGAMSSLEQHRLSARLVQAPYGLTFYLWKTFVPLNLSPLYILPVKLDPLDWPFLLSGAVVLAITGGLLVVRRRWPAGLVTWGCYGVLLTPVLGIAQSGPQLVADRYTYLSCLGFAVLAGAGLLVGWRACVQGRMGRQRFALMTGLATVVVVGLGVLTWHQVQVWHDSERLWRHVLAIDPESSIAHNNLGIVLVEQRKLTQAIYHYQQAVRIQPAYAEAHSNLANALAKLGKVEDAIRHYLKAVEIQPGFAAAYNNLGAVLVRQGKLEEAIHHYQQAVRIQPAYAEAHSNLGWALGQLGRLEEAIVSYQTALRVAPKDWIHRQFVQKKLDETLAKLQMGKSR